MAIEVREVSSKKELKKFVKFPHKLYKDCKYYVPAFDKDEYRMFSPENPSRQYCDIKLWLAYKEGEVVGRVAGIVNKKANELFNEKKIRFGWFDTVNDIEVCRTLIETVEEWGRGYELSEIHGPLCFTDMDKECLLTKGFDFLPSVSNLYNYEYYVTLLEELGFKSVCEWKQYEVPASQPVPEKMKRVNELMKEKYKLKVPQFKNTKKEIYPYVRKFFHALNATFSGLYGFVPLTDEEIDWYAKQYFPFLRPEYVSLIIDENDEVVGFGLSMPTLSKAFQKAKGKLFPFGWIPLLRALKKNDYIDLYVNGVRPEWQHKGIHALYYTMLNEAYIKNNVKMALTYPQIVVNEAVKVWDQYEGQQEVIRRAIFEREIPKK